MPGECRCGYHGARVGSARQGHHPRYGRRPARAEPTSSLAPGPVADIGPDVPSARVVPRGVEALGVEVIEVEGRADVEPSIARDPPRERHTWHGVEVQAGTSQEWASFDAGASLATVAFAQ